MQKNCYQDNSRNNHQSRMCPMTEQNCNNAMTDGKQMKSVAMAYVPWQKDSEIYEDLEKAYCIGTIFPVLNLPFCGKR